MFSICVRNFQHDSISLVLLYSCVSVDFAVLVTKQTINLVDLLFVIEKIVKKTKKMVLYS